MLLIRKSLSKNGCRLQEMAISPGGAAAEDISPRGSKEESAADKAPSMEPLDEGTDRTLAGVVQVVSHELLSPRSSEALRKLADECLKASPNHPCLPAAVLNCSDLLLD